MSTKKYVAILLGIVLSFALLAYLVVSDATLATDEAVLRSVHTVSSLTLDDIVGTVTIAGDPLTALILGLIVVVTLLQKRRRPQAILVAIFIGASTLLTALLKTSFERARPELWAQSINELSYSFPSGHATASAILAITAFYLCKRWRRRPFFIALLVAYVLTVGLSRLYLGVHYPTDIIGGWLVSTFVCTVTLGFIRSKNT